MILLVGVLRSGGDYLIAAIIELGGMYFYSVPVVLVSALVLKWSPVYVFMILSSEWIIKTGFLWKRFNQKIWLKRLL